MRELRLYLSGLLSSIGKTGVQDSGPAHTGAGALPPSYSPSYDIILDSTPLFPPLPTEMLPPWTSHHITALPKPSSPDGT